MVVSSFLADPTVGQDWSREQFTSESGLHQNRVQAMERDPAGALLIGTEGGLVRYDGQKFQHLGLPGVGGLQPSRVLDIIPTLNGEFVIRDPGCNQFLYSAGTLSLLTVAGPSRQPTSRFAGAACSAEVQFTAMDPDSLMDAKSEWPYAIRSVPLDTVRWCLRTEQDLLIYEGKRLVDRIKIPTGKSIHLFELSGNLFTFDHKGAIHRIDPVTREVTSVVKMGFPEVQQVEGKLAWRLFWNRGNNEASLIRGRDLYFFHSSIHGDTLTAKQMNVDLPSDCKVSTVVWMPDHNMLAVGTDTKGLFIYKRMTMRTIMCELAPEGANNAYNAQVVVGEENIWAGARNQNSWFTPEGCHKGSIPIGAFDPLALIKDSRGRIWFGRNDSLFRASPPFSTPTLVSGKIAPLTFLELGDTMLVGSSQGIFRIVDDRVILAVPIASKDPSSKPMALAKSPDGSIWVGKCKGVFKVDIARRVFEPIEGLSNICARTLKNINGSMFIGTYGSGAYIFSDGRPHRLPTDQQDFLSHVHAFMLDRSDRLWMSTNQGLFNVRLQALEEWCKDTTVHIYYAYYGRSAGILNVEFNGGCDPPYVITPTGYASFPTMEGLVVFQPELIPDVFPKEPLLFLSAELDGARVLDIEHSMIPADHRELIIRFSLAYWGDPVNVQLEYALDEEDWMPVAIGSRELRLSHIGFGQHRLSIRKVGSGNPDDQLRFTLLVETPFYRTVWFVMLTIVAFVGIVWLAVRLNVARLRRRNAELERNVLERTKELTMANEVLSHQLETKEMLVSIISHDIVTPLRFISRVAGGAMRAVENNEADDLRGTLRDISMSSSKLHTNAQNLLSWIKHQDGRIELRFRNVAMYPFAEEILEMVRERATANGLVLINNVPLDDVLQTDRDVFSIVLQNLVANAVTHTHFGKVTISAQVTEDYYRMIISDTGPGMSHDAMTHVERLKTEGPHGVMKQGEREVLGLGYLIVAELLALLEGTFEVISATGHGTQVIVSLPLRPKGNVPEIRKRPHRSFANDLR